jgi:hypothetical protein
MRTTKTYSQHVRRRHAVKQMRTPTTFATPTVHPDDFVRAAAPSTSGPAVLDIPRFPTRPRRELVCAQPHVGPKRRLSMPRIVSQCAWGQVGELWATVERGRIVLHAEPTNEAVAAVRLDSQGRITLTAAMCLHLGVDVGDQVQVIGNTAAGTATLLSLTRALDIILEDS